jgi:hypothetical protein
MDFLLAEAYQIYDDEISKSSGLPMFITRSTDPNVQMMIEERVDQADAALADWDEKQSKKSDKKKTKGLTRYAVPFDAIAGEPLAYGGLEREAFYAQLAEEMKDRNGGAQEDEPFDPKDFGLDQ